VGELGERLALLRAFLAQLRFELAAEEQEAEGAEAEGGAEAAAEAAAARLLKADLAAALANLARYYGQFESAVAEAQQAGLAPIQKVGGLGHRRGGRRRCGQGRGRGPAGREELIMAPARIRPPPWAQMGRPSEPATPPPPQTCHSPPHLPST
jgi:hypothetical protein